MNTDLEMMRYINGDAKYKRVLNMLKKLKNIMKQQQ